MELIQTSISSFERLLMRQVVYEDASDAIVPDTFPDIHAIFCGFGTVNMKEQTAQEDRLLIAGTVNTTVLYEPEGGGPLQRMKVPVSFAHIEECAGLRAGAPCFVSGSVSSVRAVAVNSRKMNVKVILCFTAEGFQLSEQTVTERIAEPGVEQLSESCTFTVLSQVQTNRFTVLDDASLTDTVNAVLLHTDCELHLNECRAMPGKIMVKGDAAITCLLQSEAMTIQQIHHTIPFTQVFECAAAQANDMPSTRLSAAEMECRLEESGLLSITIGCTAFSSLKRVLTANRLKDFYAPQQEIQADCQAIRITTISEPKSRTGEAEAVLQTLHRADRILYTGAGFGPQITDNTQTKKLLVQVLYEDENGIHATEREIEIPWVEDVEIPPETPQIRLHTQTEETGIRLTAQLADRYFITEAIPFMQLKSVSLEDSTAETNSISLVMRYVEQTQDLWSIAKECHTTVSRLRQANGLQEDITSVMQTMLLIPIGS